MEENNIKTLLCIEYDTDLKCTKVSFDIKNGREKSTLELALVGLMTKSESIRRVFTTCLLMYNLYPEELTEAIQQGGASMPDFNQILKNLSKDKD